MTIRIENYSWDEIGDLITKSNKTAIIPIGSIEQHGYHLPIGTDSFVAISLAEQASELTNGVMIPPLWFGWSPHHMVLPGTITVRTEVLIEYLYDIVVSLAKHGFENFVLINGHRIVNVIWMQIAAQKIQESFDVKISIFDPAYMSKDIVRDLEFGPVGHGEEIETSHMIYINEALVNLDKAVDNPIKPKDLYSVDPSYLNDTLCYVPTTFKMAKANLNDAGGVHGEPSKSSMEKGEKYNEHLLKNLVKVIKQMQER